MPGQTLIVAKPKSKKKRSRKAPSARCSACGNLRNFPYGTKQFEFETRQDKTRTGRHASGLKSGCGEAPSPACCGRAGGVIPGVLIRVPVVVVTLLRCGRSVEPLSSTGLGVRLGPAPYDELSVVQEVSRPCDVHGDTEVSPPSTSAVAAPPPGRARRAACWSPCPPARGR